MTSKRPALNLTEPKSRRVRLKPLSSDSEAKEKAGESEVDPLDSDLSAPRGKANTKGADKAKNADSADTNAEIRPPAGTTPPVPVAESSNDLTAIRTKPTDPIKERPTNPFLFWGSATAIGLLWASGLVAFVLGAQTDGSVFRTMPVQVAILAVLALFPIGLVYAAFFALRKGAALSRQARRAEHMANQMVAPAAAATYQTTEMVETLRAQVDQAVRAVKLAQDDITELSVTLRTESERLFDAAQSARATTQSIRRIFEDERLSLEKLSEQLETRTQDVLATVERQALMVTEASDLAQAQLREAEAMLTARTTDFAATADDVKSTTITVAGELDRQAERLETAGTAVAGQIRAVEENLGQQRAGLVSAALSLRADQEDFAGHIEGLRGQLTEALAITRVATVDLGETSSRGVEVLRDLLVAAQSQFKDLLSVAEGERTTFETRIHATLSSISLMAADARDDLVSETRRALEQLEHSAAEARRAADSAAQMAQTRVDRLNESLFEAGKKADEVFDTRLNSARRLIENSADLISEAGDQTIEKLDATFAQTRDAIVQVNTALQELSHNADRLPQMAQDRLADIRRSVEDGLLAMTQAARKATVESEALDAAFQERVRRNYDMLSEAVRLMGVISTDTAATQTPALTDKPGKAPEKSKETAPKAPSKDTRKADRSEGESWSWRDLLGSMENEPKSTLPPLRDISPARSGPDDLLLKEVEALGMDTASVFNAQRIDEAITALIKDDTEGPRHMVRRLTPGAVRRLGRRLSAESELMSAAKSFTARLDRQITQAINAPDQTTALRDLLSNDTGRAYLLLDAALSDLI